MVSDNLLQNAEAGDAQAQYQIGINYLYGTDVPKDTSKAAE